MSTSRSSIRILKTLAPTTTTSIPKRSLHMTGPATFPSPAMTRDIESSKRPTADTAAVPIIPLTMETEKLPAGARHFNTTRSLKAVGDSSTIDFAYLPDLFGMAAEESEKNGVGRQVRVPILSQQRYPRVKEEEVENKVLKPQISLTSGADTHFMAPSGFAEMHDHNTTKFEGLSETMQKKAREVVEEEGMIRQVWSGLMDDIFGARKKA